MIAVAVNVLICVIKRSHEVGLERAKMFSEIIAEAQGLMSN